MERNSRNLRLTRDGEVNYRHCLQIMEEVKETHAVLAGLTATPHGKLIVSMPMAISREIVARHLYEFYQQYPQIDLEILPGSEKVDIIQDRIDLAVVGGPLSSSDLYVGKRYEGRML